MTPVVLGFDSCLTPCTITVPEPPMLAPHHEFLHEPVLHFKVALRQVPEQGHAGFA